MKLLTTCLMYTNVHTYQQRKQRPNHVVSRNLLQIYSGVRRAEFGQMILTTNVMYKIITQE